MTTVYAILFALNLLYYLNRRFDLFSLTFLTSSIYFLPALFGFTHDGFPPLRKNPILFDVYLFYFYYFIVLFAFSWVSSQTKKRSLTPVASINPVLQNDRDLIVLNDIAFILRWLTPVLLLTSAAIMGEHLIASDKKVLLENFTVFYALYQSIALIYIFSSFVCNRKVDFFFGLVYVVIDMIIGFRAVAAFSLISIGAYSLFTKPSRRKTILFALLIFFAYVIGSIYKILVMSYRLGGPTAELVGLLNVDGLLDALVFTESFTTQEVFKEIIINNFSLPLDYPLEIFRLFLPGVNNFIMGKGLGFNDYYQAVLYPYIPWGMGSNIWAEEYAMWGWYGPAGLVAILFIFLYFINSKSQRWAISGQILKLSLTIILIGPAYFYMHRNDFLYQLGITRNTFFMWLLAFYIAKYFSPFLKRHLSSKL